MEEKTEEKAEENTIILISQEGDKINFTKKSLMRSNFIKSIFENYPNEIEIPASKIKTCILKKIKDYLDHYIDIEPKKINKPLPSLNYKECVDEWDYNFINLNIDEVFEIILGANFLDIYSLSQLGCSKIASEIKGKNLDEVSNILHLNAS